MKTKIAAKLKKLSYWFSIAVVGAVVGLSLQFAKAWTEPGVAPPGGNVGAPITTGSAAQTKSGSLNLSGASSFLTVGGYSTVGSYSNIGDYLTTVHGVLVNTGTGGSPAANGLLVQNGKVGIGTLTPGAKLAINGGLHVGGDSDPGDNNLAVDGTATITGNATVSGQNLCLANGTNCPAGALQWSVNGTNISNTNTGNVGIGTASPGAKLEVAGQVKITGGSPGANKVLTSDAAGLATWQSPATWLSGGGTTNYVSKWTSGSALGNSTIYDNGNVGIGTSSPGQKLSVAGTIETTSGGVKFPDGTTQTTAVGPSVWATSGSNIYNSNAGNVGIGTSSPGYKLDVNGNANISGSLNMPDARSVQWNPAGSAASIYGGAGNGGGLALTAGSGMIWVQKSGNVGIGTSGPSYKLDVAGDIRAQGAWLRTTGMTGWFNETYSGGWYMTDSTWVRTYNSKNIWSDALVGSQGGLTVGFGGSAPPAGGAIIAGNVGIGMAPGAFKLNVNGDVNIGGKISGATFGFGGMYLKWGNGSCGPADQNPINGLCSCPAGFTDKAMGVLDSGFWNGAVNGYYHLCWK